MRAEEEQRQLEEKLQAEALRQQMEELKVKEMEVRAHHGHTCPRRMASSGLLVVLKRPYWGDD